MKITLRLLSIVAILPAVIVRADDCNPTENCGDDNCSQSTDTRDCAPHWGCPNCQWYQVGCHVERAGCEADKERYRKQCEVEKGAQNAVYASKKLECEAARPLRKAACEAKKVADRGLCEAGLAGPFRCSARDVMLKTRTDPQDGLTDFDEMSGFVTTPLKKASGQLSWRETACIGHGVGVPYRNSQRSTDGFCTVDVQLVSFTIDDVQKPPRQSFYSPRDSSRRECRSIMRGTNHFDA